MKYLTFSNLKSYLHLLSDCGHFIFCNDDRLLSKRPLRECLNKDFLHKFYYFHENQKPSVLYSKLSSENHVLVLTSLKGEIFAAKVPFITIRKKDSNISFSSANAETGGFVGFLELYLS